MYRLWLLFFIVNNVVYFNLAFTLYSQCANMFSHFLQYILNWHVCHSHICNNMRLPTASQPIFKILPKKVATHCHPLGWNSSTFSILCPPLLSFTSSKSQALEAVRIWGGHIERPHRRGHFYLFWLQMNMEVRPASYRWTGWAWEITSWCSRLQENYSSFLEEFREYASNS